MSYYSIIIALYSAVHLVRLMLSLLLGELWENLTPFMSFNDCPLPLPTTYISLRQIGTAFDIRVGGVCPLTPVNGALERWHTFSPLKIDLKLDFVYFLGQKIVKIQTELRKAPFFGAGVPGSPPPCRPAPNWRWGEGSGPPLLA